MWVGNCNLGSSAGTGDGVRVEVGGRKVEAGLGYERAVALGRICAIWL